eukprot:TRINITY_DN3801_c0_g1_i1.p1 TRINITY_DN3801_c0_g1~~TRINITY_DN3801_c0_g1_i1.p1  ORF type:complete len:79 (-),score=8.70 TRINITY_DN3801_c0_g1_i1:1203-1439(-)
MWALTQRERIRATEFVRVAPNVKFLYGRLLVSVQNSPLTTTRLPTRPPQGPSSPRASCPPKIDESARNTKEAFSISLG